MKTLFEDLMGNAYGRDLFLIVDGGFMRVLRSKDLRCVYEQDVMSD